MKSQFYPLPNWFNWIESIRPVSRCPLFLSVSSLGSGAGTELPDQSAAGHCRPSLLLGCRSTAGTCENLALYCKMGLLPAAAAGIRRSDEAASAIAVLFVVLLSSPRAARPISPQCCRPRQAQAVCAVRTAVEGWVASRRLLGRAWSSNLRRKQWLPASFLDRFKCHGSFAWRV